MKTSWIETEQLESHLTGRSEPGDALVFEAKLLLDPELNEKKQWQEETYRLIRLYGRDQLKKEIAIVHQKLFNQPEHVRFSQKIRQLFTNL